VNLLKPAIDPGESWHGERSLADGWGSVMGRTPQEHRSVTRSTWGRRPPR